MLGRRRDVRSAFQRLDQSIRLQLIALTAIVSLPLLHMGVAVVRIVRRGDLAYGAELQPGGLDPGRDTGTALKAMTSQTGTPLGWVLLLTALVGVGVSLRRRPVDWTLTAVLLTALAALAWSAQTDVLVSRYYMPTIALLAVAFTVCVASWPVRIGRIAIAGVIVGAIVSGVIGHSRVRDWARDESSGVALVKTVAHLHRTGCPVLATGLDIERVTALPVLARLKGEEPGACVADEVFIVHGSDSPDPALARVCAPGANHLLKTWSIGEDTIQVTECDAVSPGTAGLVARHLVL